MKTILLLHDESGSPKPRFQNVAGSKVTQRASEGTPGCNCDRWGHPYPDRVEHNVQAQPNLSTPCSQIVSAGHKDRPRFAASHS
jgi:hypothetical protein